MRWAGPAWLAGLLRWDDGIFSLTAIKKFAMPVKKIVFVVLLLNGLEFLSIYYNKQWRKAVRNKLQQKFGSCRTNVLILFD